ncbi:hypothetical protein CBR_g24339 [Chara braunii]|uniref:Uncharacterized protein n=1 Tax=Chara braunii TaxID=69332 RepID=A0A388JMD9_CHABU|nr:hypothetical protein CBR_g24339 [Chara braunii]|eukprot:GBG58990.1 hypothetical protein CBR_g24339 [Chara braunii]
MQDVGYEELKLRKEIEDLKAKVSAGQKATSSDEVVALKLQVTELNGFCKALEQKNSGVVSLRAENTHLRDDFKDLLEEFLRLRNLEKWSSAEVMERSPPEAPLRGKVKVDAMYTPKDMDGLHKAYKETLSSKEIALREEEALKERLTKVGASKYQMSARRCKAKRTTLRNFKTARNVVEIESDGDQEVARLMWM